MEFEFNAITKWNNPWPSRRDRAVLKNIFRYFLKLKLFTLNSRSSDLNRTVTLTVWLDAVCDCTESWSLPLTPVHLESISGIISTIKSMIWSCKYVYVMKLNGGCATKIGASLLITVTQKATLMCQLQQYSLVFHFF